MPRGWKTATGANPQLAEEFGLREHTGDYADRTAANVRDSDGTIRFAGSFRTFGELCTLKWINHYGRPYIDIDIRSHHPVIEVVEWMRENTSAYSMWPEIPSRSRARPSPLASRRS